MKGSLRIVPAEELAAFVGLGVEIAHDGFARQALDNVLPIMEEEQVATWRLLGDQMIAAAAAGGETAFLDVGTGSGFWAVLVARALGSKRRSGGLEKGHVLAIDKSRRAVEMAAANARDNDVLVDVREQEYRPQTAAPGSVAAIFMNPPYHIYPPEIAATVPLHARGGPLGVELFFSWLSVADRHLAPSGKLFFHHMCLGDREAWLVRRLPELMSGGLSLRVYDLLPPIATRDFLRGVYGDRHPDFVAKVAARFPELFYISGVVERDGRSARRREETAAATACGATWQQRIALHRAIAKLGPPREEP